MWIAVLALCCCWMHGSSTVEGSVQCRCPSGGEGCCTAVIDGLPRCNPNTGMEFCNQDYDQWTRTPLWTIGISDKYGSCRDYRSYLQYRAPLTNSTLAVSAVTHSQNEANVTVSWAHLNRTFPAEALVEVRLFESPDFRKRCFTELQCVQQLHCTLNTSVTSYTFAGAKFNFVNAVQLAVRVHSTTVLLMRTLFASRATDFQCTNTDVLEFDIERCKPPEYGNVTNLTAEVSSAPNGSHVAMVSWQPPVEHRVYGAPLFYHIVISQLDNRGLKQVFSVQPQAEDDGSVTLSGLDAAALYSVGVRAFVKCVSCRTLAMSYINLSTLVTAPPTHDTPTSTPPTSTLPTSVPPTSDTPTSPATPHVDHSTPDQPQHQTYAQVISMVMVSTIAFIILVSCTVILGIVIIRKRIFQRISSKAKSSQVTPQVNAENPRKEPSPAGSPVLPLPPDTSKLWLFSQQQPPHILEVSGSDGYLPNIPISTQQESPHLSNLDDYYGSDSASSNYSEYFGRVKVLILYSPNNHESENKSIRSLSAELANSPELNVVSHELEPHTEAFSNWLMGHLDKKGDDKVHTVLCVWTDTFRAEWNGDSNKVNSDLVAAARKVIDNGSTVSRFKVATVYLDDSIPLVLPTSLNATSKFHISNGHAIKAFIKGIAPFSTH